jgi:MFS family permease
VQLGRRSPAALTAGGGGGDEAGADGEARWGTIVPVLALSCVGSALIGSATLFLPLLATDTLGVSVGTAAIVVAVINLSGVFVSPLAGWLSDRVGRVPVLVGATLATSVTVAAVARVPHGVLFYVLVLLAGAYVFVRMPVSESFILGEVPVRHRPNVLGFYYFGSSALGSVINPVVGRLSDSHGFGTSFAVIGGAFAVITVACAAALRLARAAKTAAPR